MTTMKKRKKGQGTMEYLLLVGVIIAVLLVFLRPGGIFRSAYGNTLQLGTSSMEDMANRLSNSYHN